MTCLLRTSLTSRICSVSGDFFTFQQDNAPAHHARETVALLLAETPDFIGPQFWPPNSPDLNPVDYAVWGILQERVYRCRICDVDHLKERLIAEWRRFDRTSLTELSTSGGSDFVGVSKRTEDTLSIKFKRSD